MEEIQDQGASLRDRATAVEPVPVSPLRDGIAGAEEHPLARMVRIDEEMGLYDTDEVVPPAPTSADDLAVRRFSKATYPNETRPMDAIAACLAEVPPDEPRHIIVCVARKTEDGSSRFRYFQAGDYDAAGQVGLLRLIQDQILGID